MSRLMLSRPLALSMKPLHWDIFCTVIDNFGDIGVCWRLARQLAKEHAQSVRLWVDDLRSFQRIWPAIDPLADQQRCEGVDVLHWPANFSECFPEWVPGDVVIEAFACRLPDSFEKAMAARLPAPVWINLEYLSAENWVSEYHALPSPHPRLKLTKYFYFPGFEPATGGLLRECDLLDQRDNFRSSRSASETYWQTMGTSEPDPAAVTVSLFAYENPALGELLHAWENSPKPVVCLAPVASTSLASFAGKSLRAGDVVYRGQLELRVLPFLRQTAYDQLLWACDLNFVRGEDSFVRAQWAGRPLIWHIYPQQDEVHLKKLAAFFASYSEGLPPPASALLERCFHIWNGKDSVGRLDASLWRDYLAALPEFREHAERWTKKLLKQDDLCSQLVRFCRSKL